MRLLGVYPSDRLIAWDDRLTNECRKWTHTLDGPQSKRLKVCGKQLEMVEAVGVEPTSEKTSNRELSCFFTFIFVSSSTLRTDEDAATTSLINLVRPAQTEQGRPAYCATIGTGP